MAANDFRSAGTVVAADLVKTRDDLTASNSALAAERDELARTCKALKATNALVTRTCDDLKASTTAVSAEKDALAETCKALEASNGSLTTEKAALVDTHTVAMEVFRAKYDTLKAKKRILRAACNDFEARIAALETEKEDLHTTLREMIEVVESQGEDIGLGVDDGDEEASERGSSPAPSDASSLSEEVAPPSQDVQVVINAQAHMPASDPEAELTQARVRYRDYLKGFPAPDARPPKKSKPVCGVNTDLYDYLSKDPNFAQSSLDYVLYLPGRTDSDVVGFHRLAWGSTSCYDHAARKWTQGCDFKRVHATTQELFVRFKKGIKYMGTYACRDLSHLCPGGHKIPEHITTSQVRRAALGGRKLANDLGDAIIKERYPDGKIKVVATAFQCIGFNTQLYNSLRKRFLADRATGSSVAIKSGKRKAAREELRGGGKAKVQRRN
ncbi:hypothetical protein C8R46DRAFT_1096184 [Mycena filopes]|nr:hypothetical protein C8R46DRAFT_1096184 [Mycena filopes]